MRRPLIILSIFFFFNSNLVAMEKNLTIMFMKMESLKSLETFLLMCHNGGKESGLILNGQN